MNKKKQKTKRATGSIGLNQNMPIMPIAALETRVQALRTAPVGFPIVGTITPVMTVPCSASRDPMGRCVVHAKQGMHSQRIN